MESLIFLTEGLQMSNNLFDSYEFITGLYYNKRTSSFYKFLQTNESVKMVPMKDIKFKEIVKETRYPMWLLKHSLGVKGTLNQFAIATKEESLNSIDLWLVIQKFEI